MLHRPHMFQTMKRKLKKSAIQTFVHVSFAPESTSLLTLNPLPLIFFGKVFVGMIYLRLIAVNNALTFVQISGRFTTPLFMHNQQ